MEIWIMQHDPNDKIVFYPCCGMDVEFPITLLGNSKKHYIFCDTRRYRNWHRSTNAETSVTYLHRDAWQAIEKLPRIDILFYRRDGMGEGGSGIEVLGDQYLSHLFKKFPEDGGWIITDGSNAFGDRLNRLLLGIVSIGGFLIEHDPANKLSDDLYSFQINPILKE